MPHYVAFHLGLHCLSKNLFRGFLSTKGYVKVHLGYIRFRKEVVLLNYFLVVVNVIFVAFGDNLAIYPKSAVKKVHLKMSSAEVVCCK